MKKFLPLLLLLFISKTNFGQAGTPCGSLGTIDTLVCANALPFNWYNQVVDAAGTYTDTILGVSGCDSTINLNVTVNPTLSETIDTSICQGSTINWNGQTIDVAGTYSYTTTGSNGCDSTIILNVTVNPTLSETIDTSICQGSTINWNGQTIDAAGSYSYTTIGSNGCDSTTTLNVNFIVIPPTLVTASACSNTLPYNWNGNSYSAAGTYTAVFESSQGCDSLVILELTISPINNSAILANICSNQLPYVFNGSSYTTSGTYINTLTNQSGCDSIITIILNVTASSNTTETASICQSQLPYNWNNNDYAASGTYSITLTNQAGCDSVVTLNLNVSDASTSNTDVTICINDLPYNWNGNSYSTSGTYSVLLTNQAGCDSTATLNLSADSILTSSFDASICISQLPYVWNGDNYTTSGSYQDTLQSQGGCDSIATLNLTVNSIITVSENTSVCADNLPYEWNGSSYSLSGTYSITVTSPTSCDTIKILTLTVNPLNEQNISVSVCENRLPYYWNGIPIAVAGIYTDTIAATTGCRTIENLTVTIDPLNVQNISVSVCENRLPYYWNGIPITVAGTYTDTLASTNACDTIRNLTVTIDPLNVQDITMSVCENRLPYYWNGIPITAAGTYTDTVVSTNGCDTIRNLTVTIDPLNVNNISISICENRLPFYYNGWAITAAGVYTDTARATTTGCDTIVNLNVTIDPLNVQDVSIAVCENRLPYDWNGVIVTAAGTYTDTVSATTGCDTIRNLTVIVDPLNVEDISVAVCENKLPYYWNGLAITTAGTYTDTVTATSGCDTIKNLTVTVDPLNVNNISISICENRLPFYYNGWPITAAGTYTDTANATSGCDTIVNLIVTIDPLNVEDITETICSNQLPYNWNGMVLTAAGNYTDTVTATAGCDTVKNLILIVNQPDVTNITASVCSNELPYSWNGMSITASGTYTESLLNQTGCDSIINLDFTVLQAPNFSVSIIQPIGSYSDGSITATATGGTAPYLYSWSNGGSTETISNIDSGNYTLTVTDSNGCGTTNTIVVNSLPDTCRGYVTYTQAVWGAGPRTTLGGYMKDLFNNFFRNPNFLSIGCTPGNKMRFTNYNTIDTYLPSAGPIGLLPSGTTTNPNTSSPNMLAGEVIALTMNVFSDRLDPNFAPANGNLSNLFVVSGPFVGRTVQEVLDQANKYLGGCPTEYLSNDIYNAVRSININYENGTVDRGYLRCRPVGPRPAPTVPSGNIVIFPNPTNGPLTISIDLINDAVVSVILSDIFGGRILERNYGTQMQGMANLPLDLGRLSLANGIYMITIKEGSKIYTRRIVLNR